MVACKQYHTQCFISDDIWPDAVIAVDHRIRLVSASHLTTHPLLAARTARATFVLWYHYRRSTRE